MTIIDVLQTAANSIKIIGRKNEIFRFFYKKIEKKEQYALRIPFCSKQTPTALFVIISKRLRPYISIYSPISLLCFFATYLLLVCYSPFFCSSNFEYILPWQWYFSGLLIKYKRRIRNLIY